MFLVAQSSHIQPRSDAHRTRGLSLPTVSLLLDLPFRLVGKFGVGVRLVCVCVADIDPDRRRPFTVTVGPSLS